MGNYYNTLQEQKQLQTISVIYPVDRENLIFHQNRKNYHYFAPLDLELEVGDIVVVNNNGTTNYVLVVDTHISLNDSFANRTIEYKTTYAEALAAIKKEKEIVELKLKLDKAKEVEDEVSRYESLLNSSDPSVVEMAEAYIRYLRGR